MAEKIKRISQVFFGILFLCTMFEMHSQELYELPESPVITRWTSFENPGGEKGQGAQENQGAKGHAFDRIKGGESIDLLNFQGSGVVQRIWLTFNDRSPERLRALKIEMFWDNEEKPAVSVPLGDFFGIGLGQKVAFESELFSDPEGRSFNCFVPMPFKEAARIRIKNEQDSSASPVTIFYDVNFAQKEHEQEELLYFHAYWSRNAKTQLKEDFELLPEINGKGRFLGTNIGVITAEEYGETWWGEGEVKIYLDGDSEFPSLVGSGTEDYIGTAYGQGAYAHMYQGSPIADPKTGAFAFYRYHVPDPVYFYKDIKVTIQQIGGAPKKQVKQMIAEGAELIPISIDHGKGFTKLLELSDSPDLDDPDLPDGWTNFYRRDDVSATAYFYLNRPSNDLPALPDAEKRTADLPKLK